MYIPQTFTQHNKYRSRDKVANRTPQEEIYIIAKLTEIELKHLFSGLVVTEGQYILKEEPTQASKSQIQ